MDDFEIKFATEDVVRTCEALQSGIHEEKTDPSGIIHYLISHVHEAVGTYSYILVQAPSIPPLENLVQKAVLSNMYLLWQDHGRAIHRLFNPAVAREKMEIGTTAGEYLTSLKLVQEFLPALPVLEMVGKTSPYYAELCNKGDNASRIAFYSANRLFCPEFTRENFNLERDLSAFALIADTILGKEQILLRTGVFEQIVTTEDYSRNAIEPLVWNVRQHAYNLENNIHGRQLGRKFIKVDGTPDGDKHKKQYACPGMFTVIVKDEGFGIREEHLAHIFDQGFSTKNQEGHGIGLYAVKQFVEQRGGTISVESTLGEGTKFSFTIPYLRREGNIFYQR